MVTMGGNRMKRNIVLGNLPILLYAEQTVWIIRYVLSVPKVTANMYCICLSINLQYTSADAVQICGTFWDTLYLKSGANPSCQGLKKAKYFGFLFSIDIWNFLNGHNVLLGCCNPNFDTQTWSDFLKFAQPFATLRNLIFWQWVDHEHMSQGQHCCIAAKKPKTEPLQKDISASQP